MPTTHDAEPAAWLRLLTTRSLIAVPTLVTFAIVAMAPNLFFDVVSMRGPAGAWLFVSAVATGCALTALLLASPMLLRPRRPTADTVVAVVAIGAAALLKSLVVAAFAEAGPLSWLVEVPLGQPGPPRVIANVLYSLLATGIACAVVTASREHRVRRARLFAERGRLLLAQATMSERLRAAEEQLRRDTHEVLDPAIEQVRGGLETRLAPADTERVLVELSAAVTDVVRPMSHRYANEPPDAALPEIAHAEGRSTSWLHHDVDVPAAIHPVTIGVLCVAGMAAIMPLVKAPAAAYAATLAVNIAAAALIALVRWLWPERFRVMRGRTGLILLLIMYLTVFLITTVGLDTMSWMEGMPRYGAMAAGYKTILATVVTMFAISQDQRRAMDAALVQANDALARVLSAMRRELWLIRRRMSLALHGSVQSALIAAMLLLRDDPDVDADEVLQRIDQALAVVDAAERSADVLPLAIAETRTLWAGVAHVEVVVEPDALALIDAQPGLASCCAEIVREAVGNAVRHGKARRIEGTVALLPDDLVEVRVRDNGHGGGGSGVPGLGSQVLDEVCVRWQRTCQPVGTELVAVLA